MSASIPVTANESTTAPLPVARAPIPAPPKKSRAVPQTPHFNRREHEVQRLIRDLAALAASNRAQVP